MTARAKDEPYQGRKEWKRPIRWNPALETSRSSAADMPHRAAERAGHAFEGKDTQSRYPHRRFEADEPIARGNNAWTAFFQVLDTQRHCVDVDGIRIAESRKS